MLVDIPIDEISLNFLDVSGYHHARRTYRQYFDLVDGILFLIGLSVTHLCVQQAEKRRERRDKMRVTRERERERVWVCVSESI